MISTSAAWSSSNLQTIRQLPETMTLQRPPSSPLAGCNSARVPYGHHRQRLLRQRREQVARPMFRTMLGGTVPLHWAIGSSRSMSVFLFRLELPTRNCVRCLDRRHARSSK